MEDSIMPTISLVKEKILHQLEQLVPDADTTEDLMLASKAVLDLDVLDSGDDTPPDLDDIIRRLAALEVGLKGLEDVVEEQEGTISSHVGNVSNPHNVAANQSGAYSVSEVDENFSLNTHNHDGRYAKVDHVHDNLVPIERTINGRSLVRDIELTKADIKLNNVHNWGVSNDINNPSSELYATAHAVNTLYELIKSGGIGDGDIGDAEAIWKAINEIRDTVNSHIANYKNPHNVSAENVGAYNKNESDSRYLRVDDTAPPFERISLQGPDGKDASMAMDNRGLILSLEDKKHILINKDGNMVVDGDVGAGSDGNLTSNYVVVAPDTIDAIIKRQDKLEQILTRTVETLNQLIKP